VFNANETSQHRHADDGQPHTHQALGKSTEAERQRND
jgi:hypothetical protein